MFFFNKKKGAGLLMNIISLFVYCRFLYELFMKLNG